MIKKVAVLLLSLIFLLSIIFFGNIFEFKLDEIHKAIYNYEKALIIDQDFTEAKENIELSKLKLIDKIDEMPELFFISIYKILKIINWVQINRITNIERSILISINWTINFICYRRIISYLLSINSENKFSL